MRWVQSPALFPARCVVLPQVGAHDPAGYIDTGMDNPDLGGRVYVSVRAVQAMAEGLGYRLPVPEREKAAA